MNANFEQGLYKSAALRKALVVSFHEVDDFEENWSVTDFFKVVFVCKRQIKHKNKKSHFLQNDVGFTLCFLTFSLPHLP